MTTFLRRFAADRSGAFAVLFALVLPILFLALGTAVDITMATLEKQRLQTTLDAATLSAMAGGTKPDDAAFKEQIARFFSAQTGRTFSTEDIEVISSNRSVVVRVHHAVRTAFIGNLMGEDFAVLEITVETGILGKSTRDSLEVVLVADTSTYMMSDMDALRKGAENIVDALEELAEDDTDLDVKMGLVPFGSGVVLDPYGLGQDIDGNAYDNAFLAPHKQVDFSLLGTKLATGWRTLWALSAYPLTDQNFTYYKRRFYCFVPAVWQPTPMDWTTTWVDPSGRIVTYELYEKYGAMLAWPLQVFDSWSEEKRMRECRCDFNKSFHRDDYTLPYGQTACVCGNTPCTYPGPISARHIVDFGDLFFSPLPQDLDDMLDPSAEQTLRLWPFVRGVSERELPYDYNDTPRQTLYNGLATFGNPLIPLTNDFDTLREQVQNWVYWGTPNSAAGLVWAYRVLSPAFPFQEGANFENDRAKKVVIMIVDGFMMRNPKKEDTTIDALREKEACDALKEKGVTIYSILKQEHPDRVAYFCGSTIPAITCGELISDDPDYKPSMPPTAICVPARDVINVCSHSSPEWVAAQEANRLTSEVLPNLNLEIEDLHNYCAGAKGVQDNDAYKFSFSSQDDLVAALTDIGDDISSLRIGH